MIAGCGLLVAGFSSTINRQSAIRNLFPTSL